MDSVLAWCALITAGGSIAAIVTFWMNRGEAEDRITTAMTAAVAAGAKADLFGAQLAEARIEFARDYATHKDLIASETRYAAAADGLRVELRGMNDRLDRIIENFAAKPRA